MVSTMESLRARRQVRHHIQQSDNCCESALVGATLSRRVCCVGATGHRTDFFGELAWYGSMPILNRKRRELTLADCLGDPTMSDDLADTLGSVLLSVVLWNWSIHPYSWARPIASSGDMPELLLAIMRVPSERILRVRFAATLRLSKMQVVHFRTISAASRCRIRQGDIFCLQAVDEEYVFGKVHRDRCTRGRKRGLHSCLRLLLIFLRKTLCSRHG